MPLPPSRLKDHAVSQATDTLLQRVQAAVKAGQTPTPDSAPVTTPEAASVNAPFRRDTRRAPGFVRFADQRAAHEERRMRRGPFPPEVDTLISKLKQLVKTGTEAEIEQTRRDLIAAIGGSR